MDPRRIFALLLAAAGGTLAIVATQSTLRQNRWAQYEHELQDPIDDMPAWHSASASTTSPIR
jgi:hypothetical protein